MEGLLSLGLVIGILMLAMFTLGAVLGWRWEARNPRFVPLWIWVSMELVQAAIIAWLVVFGAIPRLAVITAILWLLSPPPQVRARLSARGSTE